ncbi:MAG TPA: ABC transporter permease [Bryobacteraceae bacterium]|nr:ABC transporter permease [Bryobacteraceae bacterium]
MAIPIAYNLRNLVVRRTTTLMTALGIALTVAVLLAVLALVSGLRTAFRSSADPLHILVMRVGGTSELNSVITNDVYQSLKVKPGIAVSPSGEPLASLEVVQVINLPSVDSPTGMNVTLRGLTTMGVGMRHLRLVSGRWFAPGQREVVVGKSTANRYPGARMGERIRFGKGLWTVVGVMDGGHSALNSEIWGDLGQVASDYNRQDGLSSVLVQAQDKASVPALMQTLDDDQRLNVKAITEQEYYDRQTISGAPLQALGIFVSIIMAVGSSFAAMNTMYAAVARRATEIGTLRVLGFSRASILFSFFLESLLLSVLGGLLGCVLALPLNNVETGIGNFMTFSEIAFNFQVTVPIMVAGVTFALLMGAFGGLLPARMAAKKEILTALRET